MTKETTRNTTAVTLDPDRLKEWHEVKGLLDLVFRHTGKSRRQVALEVGISHVTLGKLVKGVTDLPQPSTLTRLRLWVSEELLRLDLGKTERDELRRLHPVSLGLLTDDEPTPDEEIFQFFAYRGVRLSRLLERATRGLERNERRMVILAVLTSMKALAVDLGRAVPEMVFQVERDLLNR